MRKFTVRHYLNTKVKGKTTEEGLILFPIYVQLIYNKFSTDKRSSTGILMTEKGFEFFQTTGKILDKETIIKPMSSASSLHQEKINIECSIEIIKKRDIDVKRKNIFHIVESLSSPVLTALEWQYNLNLDVYIGMGAENEDNYDTKYEEFLKCFAGNILDSLTTIQAYTDIDLKPFLREETSIELEGLRLVRNMLKSNKKEHWYIRHSFAEFVCMDYKGFFKDALKDKSVEYYDMMIEKLEALIDDYIEMAEELPQF